MVHSIWPHIGKNVKRAAHQANRADLRSHSSDYAEFARVDHYDHASGREYMATVDKRRSNRKKMTEKKNIRSNARDEKYTTSGPPLE